MTQNFSIEELTATSIALNNTPTEEHKERLKTLCVEVLQPLRDLYGKPIIITSGYRSAKVNEAVGGARNSQHSMGEAADITGGNRHINKILYELIRDNLEFDQLIDEFNYRWIHVSYTKRRPNRKQELKIG